MINKYHLLFLLYFFPFNALSGNHEFLNLLIHESSISPIIIKSFEEKTGVQVNVKTYQSRSERNEILIKDYGTKYDLVSIESSMISSFARAGWIKQNPPKNDIIEIESDIYGFLISENIKDQALTWKDFFNLCYTNPTKIYLIDEAHITIPIALASLNIPEIDATELSIKNIKNEYFNNCKYQLYKRSTNNITEILNSKHAHGLLISHRDAYNMTNHYEEYDFIIPSDKTIYENNYIIKLSSSENTKNSKLFINFLKTKSLSNKYNKNPSEFVELIPKDSHKNKIFIDAHLFIKGRSK